MHTFRTYGRRYALIDEDDPPRPYARTTIGFTARELPNDDPGPAVAGESLEDAQACWVEEPGEAEEED